jgi:hemoglobin/transferrin/lactoferrin receptor protein
MADDQLIVNLSLNNVFDKYYFDHGTFGYDTDEMENIGLPEPGRDVRLTVSYKF